MLLVVAIALPLVPANAIDPGVYYCVIERMVGIQPEHSAGHDRDPLEVPRYAGKIEPDPARFMLRISKVSEMDPLCAALRQLNPEEAHKSLWPHCDPVAKYKAEFPGNIKLVLNDSEPLVSVFGVIFHGRFSKLYVDEGRFQMVGLLGVLGSYLSEGTCERFKE